MAQITELSVTATPGMVHSFSAKAVSEVTASVFGRRFRVRAGIGIGSWNKALSQIVLAFALWYMSGG